MSYYPEKVRELNKSIVNLIGTATKLRGENAVLRRRLLEIRKELRDMKIAAKAGRKKK